MNSVSDVTEENCCGCRACEMVCPKKAIKMEYDSKGFLLPRVQAADCIECGICKKRCPIEMPVMGNPAIKVYAARNQKDEVTKKSSSGGIFPVFAEEILNAEGVVFGCAFHEKMEAQHIKITSPAQILLLQGSKYVQSNTAHTYADARECLKEGKKVLYSGTPCQIAGLKAYLGSEYDNLYTIETICHGAPSPGVFQKYLQWLKECYGSEVNGFVFRDKTRKAWGGFDLKVDFADGKRRFLFGQTDPYFASFFEGKISRESCYRCPYASEKRVADITLGDYWGIEKAHTEFTDPRGVSVVSVNTDKGQRLFHACKNKMAIVESSYQDAARFNPELKRPAIRPENYDAIYNSYQNDSTDVFFSRTLNPGLRIKKRINNILPFWLRTIVKKYK